MGRKALLRRKALLGSIDLLRSIALLRLWRKTGIGNLEILIGFIESNPAKNPVNKTYGKENDEEGTYTDNPTLSSINSIITIITVVIVIAIVRIRLGPVDSNVGCSQTNNTTNQTKESYEANNGDVDKGWQDESMSLLTESSHDQGAEHDVDDVEIRHT